MLMKSSFWVVIFISIFVIGFVATGCAKKQMVKKEVAARPSVEAKKEMPKPAAQMMEPPKAPPAPAPAAGAEAKPEAAPKREAAPAPFDLAGMRIQFAFDDYSLATHSKENLEKIAAWMKSNPGVRIQIQGNTCDIGTAEYNLALGEQRATSAKKYLGGLGVEEAKVSTISYGFERPRLPNKDEANRSLNRRDEFVSIK